MKQISLITISFLALLLTACGGGGSSDDSGGTAGGSNVNQNAATVTATNQESIGKGLTISVSNTIASDDIDLPIGASVTEADLMELALKAVEAAKNASSLPMGLVYTEDCTVGGSITMNFVGLSENATSFPSSGTIIFTFNRCNEGSITMNGTMTMYYSGGSLDSANGPKNNRIVFDLDYSNIAGADDFTFNGEMNCTNYMESCTISQLFSEGGVTYKVEDASVSYSYGAYDVDATVYLGKQGYVSITSSGITLNGNGNICSGTINVTDSTQNSVMSIDYYDCDTFTVTFDSQSTTYNQ